MYPKPIEDAYIKSGFYQTEKEDQMAFEYQWTGDKYVVKNNKYSFE